jgi:hypothetical protein
MEKDMLLKIVTKAENEELFNSLPRVEKKIYYKKHCWISIPFSKKENNFKQKNNYLQKCSNESELRN